MNKVSVNKGKQLNLARHFRGITRYELGRNAMVNPLRIRQFEYGFDDSLGDAEIKRIMEILDFPVSWLDQKSPECESWKQNGDLI